MMGISNPHIDNWGHFGGLVTGVFLGFILLETRHVRGIEYDDLSRIKENKYLNRRTFSIVVLAVYYIGGFLSFYLFRNP